MGSYLIASIDRLVRPDATAPVVPRVIISTRMGGGGRGGGGGGGGG